MKLAPVKNRNNLLDSLVLLRGIAVIMVCFSHFGNALSKAKTSLYVFTLFHKYGIYGVHIFFVVSGFVIPLSLYKGKYKINNYPRFLYKRVLRLHLPYLAALALTLIIIYFSYRIKHLPFPENAVSIFKSVFYLHAPVDNPVFWTLFVEAQYYIFIGLFFELIMNYSWIAYFIVMPILLIAGQVLNHEVFFLFYYFVFFFVGNVGYMIYLGNGNKTVNYVVLAGLLLFIAFLYELPAFISALVAITFILLFRKSLPPVLKFAGTISYSIYLIHFPIGTKIINFTKGRVSPSYYWVLFFLTLIITLALAWIFYKVVEEFSERLSKKIKYNVTKSEK